MSHSSYLILSPWYKCRNEMVKRYAMRQQIATVVDIWKYLSCSLLSSWMQVYCAKKKASSDKQTAGMKTGSVQTLLLVISRTAADLPYHYEN